MRTDSLDLVAQTVVTCGREFGSRLMHRNHVRTAPVTVRFDQPHFGAAHRGVNVDARDVEDRVANGRSEEIERLEKMDIGIPERVVGVEYEVQRLSRSRGHLRTGYRGALERANGRWRGHRASVTAANAGTHTYARALGSAAGRIMSAPVEGLRPTYTSVW